VADSTEVKARSKSKREKRTKPDAHFPMFAHISSQWARNFRGKLKYFGVWDDQAQKLARHCDPRLTANLSHSSRYWGVGRRS
jgi:hypothetical protein